MDDLLVAEIRERVRREPELKGSPAGFPLLPDLPLARYTDRQLYALEVENAFKRRWLFACNESEVATPGRFKVLDNPIAPIVVVRGKDGAVRAFLNACRHRGAPVVAQECGTAKRFVCPYHAWAYDLDGSLLMATQRSFFGDLTNEDRALAPVRCEQWGTMIFVNLDPDAPSLQDEYAPLISRYSDIMEAPLRLGASRSWDIECNWKVALEGFMEAYHVSTVHVQSGGNLFDASAATIALYPNGHSIMFVPYYDSVDLTEFYPRNAPEIKDPRVYEDLNPSLFCFPNMVAVGGANSIPMQQFWPLGIDRCRMTVSWYAVDWGDAPSPPGWEEKMAGFDRLTMEDLVLFPTVQRSIEAAAHTGIPLQYRERRIWQFHADLDRQIGVEQIPTQIRVDRLLDHYIET
jgi:phenylpropionate dioxygenase-like ring-hydroxylating dioxygenase large terminal subunit